MMLTDKIPNWLSKYLKKAENKLQFKEDLDMGDNNIDDIKSIDGGGDAISVEDDTDYNGNSITNQYSGGLIVRQSGTEYVYDLADYSDIGAAINQARTDHGLDGAAYRVIPGNYDLTTAIDYTHVASDVEHGIDLRGVNFTVKTGSGTMGWEMVGTQRSHITVLGGRFYGQNTTIVDGAILLARSTNASYDDNNAFINFVGTNTDGYWNHAPIVNISSEAMNYMGCDFNNSNSSGYAGVFTRTNILGTSTQYADGIDDDLSFSTNMFTRCGFRSEDNSGDGVILAEAWQMFKFDVCYFQTWPGNEPIFDMRFGSTSNHSGFTDITFDTCSVDPPTDSADTTNLDMFRCKNESGGIKFIKQMSVQGGHFAVPDGNYWINDVGTHNVVLYEGDLGFSHPFDAHHISSSQTGCEGIKLQGNIVHSKIDGDSIDNKIETGGTLANSVLKNIGETDITGTIENTNYFLDDGWMGTVLKTDTSYILNLSNQSDTADPEWVDLDISAAGSGYVPDYAKGVIVRMLINSGTQGAQLSLRKNGHTDSNQFLTIRAFQTGTFIEVQGTVQMDADGLIEYRIKGAGTDDTDVLLKLVGWIR